MIKAWYFDDTGDAYDTSQCNEAIHSGDLLVTPTTAGVLYKAWPVAVRGEAGAFHTVEAGSTLADLEDGAFAAAYQQALLQPFATPADIAASKAELSATFSAMIARIMKGQAS